MFKADFNTIGVALERYSDEAGDHLPFVAALALTWLAQKIRDREREVMQEVFENPTPFTMNSLKVTPARKDRLESSVWFKDPPRLSSRDHFLVPQVEGGGREYKGFEVLLGKKYLMPGSGLALDQYGNIPPAKLTQILSVLQKFAEVGYSMNRKGKGKGTRSPAAEYFMVKEKRGGLRPGIYQRTTKSTGPYPEGASPLLSRRSKAGRGLGAGAFQKGSRKGAVRQRGVLPVLIPGNAPSYSKRFPFYEEAQKIIDQFGEEAVRDAINYAWATSL